MSDGFVTVAQCVEGLPLGSCVWEALLCAFLAWFALGSINESSPLAFSLVSTEWAPTDDRAASMAAALAVGNFLSIIGSGWIADKAVKADKVIEQWGTDAVMALQELGKLGLAGIVTASGAKLAWARGQLESEGLMPPPCDASNLEFSEVLDKCGDLEERAQKAKALSDVRDEAKLRSLDLEGLRLQLDLLTAAMTGSAYSEDALKETLRSKDVIAALSVLSGRLAASMKLAMDLLFPRGGGARVQVAAQFADEANAMQDQLAKWNVAVDVFTRLSSAAGSMGKLVSIHMPKDQIMNYKVQKTRADALDADTAVCCFALCRCLCGSSWQPPVELVEWRRDCPTVLENAQRGLKSLGGAVQKVSALNA